VLYYTRILRDASANSKPSSGVVVYRILKVSNHIKNSNGSVEFVLKFGIAVLSEVKTNISLANVKLKQEDELNKSINVKLNYKM
jgi:hypothetical protein